MARDLILALPALVVVAVIPGFFWARLLVPTPDHARTFAYSVAFSMVLTPSVSLILTRVFGSGVTLGVALASVAGVFFGGLAAYAVFGAAKGLESPFSRPPAPLGLPVLAPLIACLALSLAAAFEVVPGGRAMLPAAALAVLAGVAYFVFPRPAPPEDEYSEHRESRVGEKLCYAGLAAVLGFALLRGYLGPVLYDWPYMRGDDQYQHTIMTRLILSDGAIGDFMLYPPGLHFLLAGVSRFSGLDPLSLFPVLAPLFMAAPALAVYTLASRLWGRPCGVAAALFAGLLLGGTYWYFEHGRYPNLIAAQFLLVLAVSSFADLLEKPNFRSGLAFALLGSSVVLFHQVGSLYEAAMFGVAAIVFLPYLLVRERRKALAVIPAFALLGALSVAFAWTPYEIPQTVAGLFGGSDGGSGSDAVAMAVGTKEPFPFGHLLFSTSQPVLWLGLLGALLVVAERSGGVSYAATRFVLVFWAVMMFIGSRTAFSAFPDRFERDLGIPLSLLAGFAFAAMISSLRPRSPSAVFATALAVVLATTLIGVRATSSLGHDSSPSYQLSLKEPVAEAGAWLRENNDGGTIIATPYLNDLPSRGILALGGYTGMQSFTPMRVERARDLPPTGAEPLRDAWWVLNRPTGEKTAEILAENDVRYLVIYKRYPGVGERYLRVYAGVYETAFENEDVVIFETGR